jgi:hypothetical protein
MWNQQSPNKSLGVVGGLRLPSSSLGHKAPFERLGSRGSHLYGACQHRLGTDGRTTKGSSWLKSVGFIINVVDRRFHGREEKLGKQSIPK